MKVQRRKAAAFTVPAYALSGCSIIPAGRFLFDRNAELPDGEATQVSGEDRKGAGTCTFSAGARCRVHIGNRQC